MPEERENSQVEEEIDRNLRRVYEETLKEPIPDRFNDLLDQLRKLDTSGERRTDG